MCTLSCNISNFRNINGATSRHNMRSTRCAVSPVHCIVRTTSCGRSELSCKWLHIFDLTIFVTSDYFLIEWTMRKSLKNLTQRPRLVDRTVRSSLFCGWPLNYRFSAIGYWRIRSLLALSQLLDQCRIVLLTCDTRFFKIELVSSCSRLCTNFYILNILWIYYCWECFSALQRKCSVLKVHYINF